MVSQAKREYLARARSQRPAFQRCLEDDRLEVDNNLVEDSIRPTAMGKIWLFIGADEAGWCAAMISSIITSCRNRGIDSHAYLKVVLDRLPSMTNRQIPDITPAARSWLKTAWSFLTRGSADLSRASVMHAGYRAVS